MNVKIKIIDAVKSAVDAAISDGIFKTADNLPEINLEVPPKKNLAIFQ